MYASQSHNKSMNLAAVHIQSLIISLTIDLITGQIRRTYFIFVWTVHTLNRPFKYVSCSLSITYLKFGQGCATCTNSWTKFQYVKGFFQDMSRVQILFCLQWRRQSRDCQARPQTRCLVVILVSKQTQIDCNLDSCRDHPAAPTHGQFEYSRFTAPATADLVWHFYRRHIT